MQTEPSAPDPESRHRSSDKARPRPRRRLPLPLLILFFFLAMGGLLLVVSVLLFGVVASGLGAGMDTDPLRYQEEVLREASRGEEGSIALIHLEGILLGNGSPYVGTNAVLHLGRQLRQAAEDDAVRAVVLQVDSPGGSLSASDLLYHQVRRIKEAGKPVVVVIGSMAASGGYYVSAPADHIVAGPTSMIGSIGVILHRFEVDELMKKIGVESDPIKSVKMKDMGSPFRPLAPEERAFLNDQLQHFQDRFVRIVAEGRALKEQTVRKVADGRVYTAATALEDGLIDEIGYIEDGLAKAEALAGLSSGCRVVTYRPPFRLAGLLSNTFGGNAGLANAAGHLRETLLEGAAPRAYALYAGGAPVAGE